MKPTTFFNSLDLSKIDEGTAQYIRENILDNDIVNLAEGSEEFSIIEEKIRENYPDAVGGIDKVKVKEPAIADDELTVEQKEWIQAISIIEKRMGRLEAKEKEEAEATVKVIKKYLEKSGYKMARGGVIRKSYLPESVEHKGKNYLKYHDDKYLTGEDAIREFKMYPSTAPKDWIIVEVLSKNLRDREDLHGKPYKPTKHVYIAEGIQFGNGGSIDMFWETFGGMEINSIEFEGVVYVDGKNRMLYVDGEPIKPTNEQISTLQQEGIEGELGDIYYKQGGKVGRPRSYEIDKQQDEMRKAKPQGYRFKGKNYSRPTKGEILKDSKKPESKQKIYYEDRINRSDKNLRRKLEKGGNIDNSNLVRYAETDEQLEVIQDIIPTLDENGIQLRFGTTMGKSPQTVVFDKSHHDGILHINGDGYYAEYPPTFGGEEFQSSSELNRIINEGEDEFAKGGKVGRPRSYEIDKHQDEMRKAKPQGYRFKGKNYSRPTKGEILKDSKKPESKQKIYYEDRIDRSDKNLRRKLAQGGEISKDEAIIEALNLGVDFDKDFHAQSFGNELNALAKRTGYRKSKTASGSLGRSFFEHLEKAYDKSPAYYKEKAKKMAQGGSTYAGGGEAKKLNWRLGVSFPKYYYGFNNGRIYSTQENNITDDLQIKDIELVFQIKAGNFLDEAQRTEFVSEMSKIFPELSIVEIVDAIHSGGSMAQGGSTYAGGGEIVVNVYEDSYPFANSKEKNAEFSSLDEAKKWAISEIKKQRNYRSNSGELWATFTIDGNEVFEERIKESGSTYAGGGGVKGFYVVRVPNAEDADMVYNSAVMMIGDIFQDDIYRQGKHFFGFKNKDDRDSFADLCYNSEVECKVFDSKINIPTYNDGGEIPSEIPKKFHKYYKQAYNNPSQFNLEVLESKNDEFSKAIVWGVTDAHKDRANGTYQFKMSKGGSTYAGGGEIKAKLIKRFEAYSDEDLQAYNGYNEETIKFYNRKDAIDEAVETAMQEWEEENDSTYAGGGHVSKGELVWGKLSTSDKSQFLHENFTPNITPRDQELLVNKAYKFLPKKVKIVVESKYANVEDYAKGGKVGRPRSYNIDKEQDEMRKAKPKGYRFKDTFRKGKRVKNYKRPTVAEIVKDRKKSASLRKIYFETRPEKSDKNLRKKLEHGGDVNPISHCISDSEWAEVRPTYADMPIEHFIMEYKIYDAKTRRSGKHQDFFSKQIENNELILPHTHSEADMKIYAKETQAN